jgi:hypothetical protein
MDEGGWIVPPPGLIPPAREAGRTRGSDQGAGTVRPLPVFAPGGGAAAPVPPPRPVWRLTLPGGRSIPVTRTVLLGRNPSRAAHAGDAELIALDDPTSTVSKTHAVLAPDGDGLTVTDLHSTNGVLVGGSRIEPGMPAAVADGTDLLLGDLRIHVARSAPGAPEQG